MKARCVTPLRAASFGAVPQLLELLNGALNIADEVALPPEIGARLQEVIDVVEGHMHKCE